MTDQTYTSAATSRNQVPALLRALVRGGEAGAVNVDIGGGRFERGSELLRAHGCRNVVFDPYNRSDAHNRGAVLVLLEQRPDTATAANVLNVIKEPERRAAVIWLASRAGAAFFSVYKGRRSGRGTATRDGWQENRKLSSYLPEVRAHVQEAEVVTSAGLRVMHAHGRIGNA